MLQTADLHILDDEFEDCNGSGNIIYWNSYSCSEHKGIFSIPQLVEQDADFLKDRYLKLIYNFGEVKIQNKRIIDHLTIRPNFSYWWATLLNEKCNYSKSPQIDNIIKLMALEKWLQVNKHHKIEISTSNVDLAASMSLLAKKMSIGFSWVPKVKKASKITLFKLLFNMLPSVFRSLIWLLHYYFSNWSLKNVGVKNWRSTTATSTFVSYLFNLDPISAGNDRYASPYWTSLLDVMCANNYSTNWLHIYLKDNLLPSSKEAKDLLIRLNQTSNGNQTHVTLASFLSLKIILYTLKDWYRITKLKKIVETQLCINSQHFWPLFKKDVDGSMSGIPAVNNLLYLNLFDKAMRELPTQKKGFYLQENQGWEFGFISNWRAAGHGSQLIGIPHSTVRFWDLRYFFYSNKHQSKSSNDLPLPDYIGVNGPVMKKMLLKGFYPDDIFIELEALRYLYLGEYNSKRINEKVRCSKHKVVLVLTDYLKVNTDKQLTLLSQTIENIDIPISFIIKNHPSQAVNLKDFNNIQGELSTRPIPELLGKSNVVYASSATSGAVDGYCAGNPVIILNDGSVLNQSPLRGLKDVHFTSDVQGLADLINQLCIVGSQGHAKNNDYFYTDLGLIRWRKLLKLRNDNLNT